MIFLRRVTQTARTWDALVIDLKEHPNSRDKPNEMTWERPTDIKLFPSKGGGKCEFSSVYMRDGSGPGVAAQLCSCGIYAWPLHKHRAERWHAQQSEKERTNAALFLSFTDYWAFHLPTRLERTQSVGLTLGTSQNTCCFCNFSNKCQ